MKLLFKNTTQISKDLLGSKQAYWNNLLLLHINYNFYFNGTDDEINNE